MKLLSVLALTTALTIVCAGPAAADPISGAISLISGGLSWFAGTAVGAFVIRTAISFGISSLANMLSPKKGQQRQRGIATETTTSGGTAPQTVILGTYATGGHLEAPMMTHGVGDDDQKYLTYVISVSDHRITDIPAVIVNGEKSRFIAQRGGRDGFYGLTANGSKFTDRAWMRWHDGTQTEADPMLVETYGGYKRPWTEDHILAGVAYAIMTFKYDSDYKQYPEVLFEVHGAPLYDPRRDSSVGGVGEQRWNDPETWEFTENPVVMIYNLLRGLTLADGSVYGLDVDADDLPLDRWVAAMNACDEPHAGALLNESRYTCGIEFSLDTEPLAVIEDILKSCGGQVAECGGIWNIDVGPAPFARAHITDEDVIVSSPRELAPFRGLHDTYNSIHASHPDRCKNWIARDAPTYYRQDWVDEDDGRRLVAELALPTVTQPGQVQRLMQELAADNRLMITHALTLPPTSLGLLPLDTLTWTSTRNGYDNKLFQVVSKLIDPATLNVKFALRERSPAEYEYEYVFEEVCDDPAMPGDGSPDPDRNPPDHEYTDPVTGAPIEPVRPDGTLGDVVALHDGAVSRSSDGGANWIRIPATFGMSKQISAIDGQGFLVRTAGAEVSYSVSLERWEKLTLDGFATQPVTVVNGDFETGDMSGWTVNHGAPAVLDTTQPPQRDGVFYVTGGDAFALSQSVSVPAIADAQFVLTADVYCPLGAEARVRVFSPDGDFAFASMSLKPHNKGSISYPEQRDSGDIAAWQVFDAPESGITHIEYFNVSAYAAGNASNIREEISLSVRDGDGNIWSGLHVVDTPKVAISHPDDAAAALQVIDWSDKSLLTPVELEMTTPAHAGDVLRVWMPAGFLLPYSHIRSEYFTVSAWALHLDGHNTAGTSNFFYPAPVGSQNVGVSEESVAPDNGLWSTVRVEYPAILEAQPTISLVAGASGVIFDNVRADIIFPGDIEVRCIARDLDTRRHLAATDTGIHAIVDGQATQLCETPFAADLLAANGDVLVIAAGFDIAISGDDGATWAQHSAGGSVVDLHARPAPVAVLFDGSVLEVAAAGLTEVSDLGTAHQLAWDARHQRWRAVSADGVVQSSQDLTVWTQEPDMPAGSAGDRRIVPLDIGRLLGRAEGSKDLFWSDGAWSVAPSLTSRIRDMSEVK